ncbi:unnamed protein product [Eruca vesicaria subsp. sativa]|uniref:FKB95-like N-terminal Kelch domain-containing protein n=1 Tax=Eruca vesicaria subsp. sativa TaxID=29727 RepID=A0ABC8JHI0_ERUVS|nr:unnamed protein product [Eruca vesicaria subsp. sativa]
MNDITQDDVTQVFPKEINEVIFTRASISVHPVVSQVSRDYNKFITSRTVYDDRAKIQKSETVIHISLTSEKDVLEWYTLRKKPLVDEYVLHPLPEFPEVPVKSHNLVASGSRIYAVSCDNSENLYIECRNYTSVVVPSTTCEEPLGVIDGKLYVVGELEHDTSSKFLKTMDIAENKVWVAVNFQNPLNYYTNYPSFDNVFIMKKRIYFISGGGLRCKVFNHKNQSMKRMSKKGLGQHCYDSSCVINNHLFCFEEDNKLKVHVKGNTWVHLRGLEEDKLPEFTSGSTKLLNMSGNLVILQNSNDKDISVTVIRLEDRNGEMWGEVFSSNIALQLPYTTVIKHALEVEL